MNAEIIKTYIFPKMKYDLKGHRRSHKVAFMFISTHFLRYLFWIKSDFITRKMLLFANLRISIFQNDRIKFKYLYHSIIYHRCF